MKIGRILGRGNKASLATTVLDPKNKALREKIIKGVGKLMNRELRMLCANKTPSMMQDTSGDALAKFSWESVWEEITEKAPTLVALLQSSVPQKTGRDKTPVICMCIAMLAKYRNPNMCHVQAAISLILHAGHVGMQVSYVSTYMQLFIYTFNSRFSGDCRSV